MSATTGRGFFTPQRPPLATWAEFVEARSKHEAGLDAFNPRMSHPAQQTYIVTRRVQAHDSTPCVAAWHQYTRHLVGQPTEAFGGRHIPYGSFQMYMPCKSNQTGEDGDTCDEEVLRVATILEEKTFYPRHGSNSAWRDRLDVYRLPKSGDLDDFVRSCVTHQKREIAHREAAGAEGEDLYIQRWNIGSTDPAAEEYQRALIVLESVPGQDDDAGWDNIKFLFTRFDLIDRERDEEDRDAYGDIFTRRVVGLESAAREMHDMRGADSNILGDFYSDYEGDFGEP
ncbi:hypothetical protein AAE478_007976 [Parahypoxylon ruwenzoriense]